MEYKKLGDIATYINGYAFKPEDRGTEGLPIIRIQDLTGNAYDLGFYDGKHPEKIEINNGDVLISWSASLGVYVWNRGKALLNQHIFKVAFNKVDVDKNYFVYAVRHKLNEMAAKTHGATMKHIIKKDFDAIQIPFPSLQEQAEISLILDKVAHVIEERREELSKLDTLIKARFVEMFGNPATPGDKFKTCKLGEVADVKSSHRVFTTEFVDEGVPFYRGTEIGVLASGQRPEDPYRISMEHYLKIASDDSKPIRGDLLLPSICNKGQVWMVDTDEPFYYKDGRVLCISPNRSVFDPRYLQLYMKMRTEAEYPKLGSGSTFAEFKIFQLKKLEIDIPPMDLQNQFAEFVTQIDKSKLLSGCRLFHSWAPENRDKPKHVGAPQRKTKDFRGCRCQQ